LEKLALVVATLDETCLLVLEKYWKDENLSELNFELRNGEGGDWADELPRSEAINEMSRKFRDLNKRRLKSTKLTSTSRNYWRYGEP
jgi:hypothetical protein